MTHPRPSAIARALCTAAAIAVLGGCSILPSREPIQIWQPEITPTTAAAPAGDFSLRIETPNTTGLLGNAGILVLPAPGEVSTYKGARWSEAPALLVRARLVDAFMAAQLPAVTTDDDHFASDWVLGGDLRAFQTEYRAGSPVVVVRFDAQLRRGGSRNLLATRSFRVTRDPAGAGIAQVVSAFGTADDQLAAQIVAWVTDEVRRAPATDAGATSRRR